MNIEKVFCVYFSPSSTTKKISCYFAESLDLNYEKIDLLRKNIEEIKYFKKNELLIIAMPVFSGRIPQYCVEIINKFKTEREALCLPIVVYGNRDFDDALLELNNILTNNGFATLAGIAAVAKHSLFTNVAKNRPDDLDYSNFDDFLADIKNKLKNNKLAEKVKIPGKKPYKKIGSFLKPVVIKELCINCGMCSRICPVNAIDIKNPLKTNNEICISCTACVNICPAKGRVFITSDLKETARSFENKVKERKEAIAFI